MVSGRSQRSSAHRLVPGADRAETSSRDLNEPSFRSRCWWEAGSGIIISFVL